MARNGLKRMLVDNGSSINIIFGATFNKLISDHELTSTTTPLYRFTGRSITLRERITFTMEIGEPPQTTMNFMEFLIIDSRSAYHGILGRPALKDLGPSPPSTIYT